MGALARKNFTCLFWKNASFCCKSHVCFSVSFRYFCDSTDGLPVFDFLLHKHNFSPEVASRAASVLTRLKNLEKPDSMLSFLKESGFSGAQLEKVVKCRPQFLSASLEDTIKPKIKIFQELGFSSDEIVKIISSNPGILHISVNNHIIHSVSVLKGLLGSDYDVAKLLRRCAWFVTADLGKTLVPNVVFLNSCGIPMERIRQLLYSHSRCLLLKPEILRKSADKAEEMGFDRRSNMFVYAIGVIASMSNETWELKLQAFRNFGFSENDILAMFRKAPLLFSGSTEKIKKTKEVLLASGKFDMSCIVNNPMSLAYNIEKRYKPRLKILGILESRNLIKNWPSLGTIYRLTDDKFFKRYICPYLNEVGEVYNTKEFLCQWKNGDEKASAQFTGMKY